MSIMAKLSPRQQQALELLVAGNSQKEVAHKLNIAGQTLKTHMQRARIKTGCKSTLALAVEFAIETMGRNE